MTDAEALKRRCGSCARFVRVRELIDSNSEVRRAGECLLSIWPAPLYENNTCNEYVEKGTFQARPPDPVRRQRQEFGGGRERTVLPQKRSSLDGPWPEELLDMDMNQFRQVLREVIQDEFGAKEIELGGRWQGGELIIKPGKEGTQEKRIPIESFFHKVVMLRDKLRVLEQKINAHPQLSDEEKVSMQQYITGCYGTLTTFNVLFANKDEQFAGQKSE